jgi:hypothetical protein
MRRLAATVGSSGNVGSLDIPRYLFQQLLAMASHAVRTKLAAMRPEAFAKISAAVEEAAERIETDAFERSRWREVLPKKPQQNSARPLNVSDKTAADPDNLAKIVAMLSSACELPGSFC